MSRFFSPFVLPFAIGAVILLIICVWKYVRWYRHFTFRQRNEVHRNFLSFRLFAAIGEGIQECLLHHRVTDKNRLLGYMHRSIALGWFLLIVAGAVETGMTVRGSHPFWASVFLRYFVHTPDAHAARFALFAQIMDTLLLYVLSGVTLAFIKSLYSRLMGMKKTTRHTAFDLFAKYSLWFIFPLRLFSESATACLYHNGGWLTQGIGNLLPASLASSCELPLWTLYSIFLCIFMISMPFSRYMHIFTEVFLIFFRRLGVREGASKSGYTMYELSACSRCGICIDDCPLNKDLDKNDVQSVYFLRDIRYKHPELSTAEDCLMCGRCQTECPVGLDLMSIRRGMRTRTGIDAVGNYTYLNRVQSFNAIGRVGYFGGCMSHLTPGVSEAMKRIFDAAGQKYWHIDGNASICCGRPLYQQGFISQAADLRRKNTQLIRNSGIGVLITSCPICYKSFSEEYHLTGVKVMHHSEYIAELIAAGRLVLSRSERRFSYHDPCELGRGSGIYDAPREVLRASGILLKTRHEGPESLCCGHNLGDTMLSWDEQSLVRKDAMDNLLAPGPDEIATACPMCRKSFRNSTAFPIEDIAEIVARQIIT